MRRLALALSIIFVSLLGCGNAQSSSRQKTIDFVYAVFSAPKPEPLSSPLSLDASGSNRQAVIESYVNLMSKVSENYMKFGLRIKSISTRNLDPEVARTFNEYADACMELSSNLDEFIRNVTYDNSGYTIVEGFLRSLGGESPFGVAAEFVKNNRTRDEKLNRSFREAEIAEAKMKAAIASVCEFPEMAKHDNIIKFKNIFKSGS